MPTMPMLGELRQDDDFADWWYSQPIPVPLFSGALLKFRVTSDVTDTGYPPNVVEAVAAFLSLSESDRLAATPRVCENHREALEQAQLRGIADLLRIEPRHLQAPDHIWRFVSPTGVAVERRSDAERDVYVTVGCSCAWDLEHGLQLVYRRGAQLVRVSAMDGHLTDADAYDLPEG